LIVWVAAFQPQADAAEVCRSIARLPLR
jgi:hypothetical protein